MALLDVVRALRADFTVRGCPVPILLGEQFLADHGEPSRVVIVPSSDTYGPKNPSVQPATQPQGFANPRSIGTRLTGATANIWAASPIVADPEAQLDADFAALDALVNTFVAALNSVATGIFAVQGGANVIEQAVHVRRGLVYTLDFQVAVPVLDIAWPPVAIVACSKTFPEETASGDISIQETFDGGATYETVTQFIAPTPPDEA